jgi:hypothetical protein
MLIELHDANFLTLGSILSKSPALNVYLYIDCQMFWIYLKNIYILLGITINLQQTYLH